MLSLKFNPIIMAIEDDFTVAVTGDIRWTSGSNYTVVELHRFLGDLADDEQAAGDDLVDITSPTPSVREGTDNFVSLNSPYNIDDTTAEHLYDGSIVQDNGDTIYDGIVNYGNAGVYIEIHQDEALIAPNFWTTGINADAALGISHRFLVKVRDTGADIDGRRLIGTTREFNYTYYEFKINGTNRGNNTLALSNTDDLNNQTAEGTVLTWTGITNTEGFRELDVDNDSTDEPYYSEWNTNQPTRSINDFYERMKWIQRRGSTTDNYGIFGDLFRGVTHEVEVTGIASGPFDAVEELTWTEATVVSAGIMVAIDSVSAPTKLWFQLISGIAPTDSTTLTGTSSSATVDVDTTVTERTIATPWCGISTGTALIGAYGFGVEPADLAVNDSLIDLDNQTNNPPNNVTFTVYGLSSGEDRLLVTNDDTGLDYDQLTLLTDLDAVDEIAIVCTTAIPTDTPASGILRIQLNTGIYRYQAYTSYTSATFTIASSDYTGANEASQPRDIFVGYIDKLAAAGDESFTTVYDAPRTMFCRARWGGASPIKTAETTGALGTTGGSATINRLPDS